MDEEQISDCLGLMIREGGQCGYKGAHGLGKPCYDETVVHLDCGDEPIHVIYMNTGICRCVTLNRVTHKHTHTHTHTHTHDYMQNWGNLKLKPVDFTNVNLLV